MALCGSGCSVPQRIADDVAGTNMGRLQREDVKGISQEVGQEIEECFDKVLAILNSDIIEAELLKIDRRRHSIMALVSRGSELEDVESVFDENSADVGIFLVSAGPKATRVEIKSLSSITADYAAMKIFPELQNKE
jgi:hypothetical protein